MHYGRYTRRRGDRMAFKALRCDLVPRYWEKCEENRIKWNRYMRNYMKEKYNRKVKDKIIVSINHQPITIKWN